jgi:NACalpha-BTF3-like transcription factor
MNRHTALQVGPDRLAETIQPAGSSINLLRSKNMKKLVIVISILTVVSSVVACSKTGGTTAGNTGNTLPLSSEAELVVGTFKLEDTGLAVTADQAKQLLPLWLTLQSLSNSSTSATEEVNAVVDQIKSAMTSEQVAKIDAMKLTRQDIMTVMSQSGVSPNGASSTTTPMAMGGFPSGGNMPSGGGGRPSGGSGSAGGPPAGDFPSGGGGFPGGGDQAMGGAQGMSATPQAGRPGGMGDQVPAPLLNALIQMLQKKIQ